MAKPSESLPQVPALSNPGELDPQVIVRIYEQKLAQMTTQLVMMEAQVESAMNDRQKLLNYINELGANKPQGVVPESVAS